MIISIVSLIAGAAAFLYGAIVPAVILLACGSALLALDLHKKKLARDPEAIRRRRAEDAAWHAHVQDEIRRGGPVPPPPSRQPPPPPPESRRAQQRRQTEERKRQAAADGVACCPRCGSTSLTSNKKGYGIGKGVVGAWAVGPIGLAAGNIGRQKVKVTCLNCGYQYKPGKGRV